MRQQSSCVFVRGFFLCRNVRTCGMREVGSKGCRFLGGKYESIIADTLLVANKCECPGARKEAADFALRMAMRERVRQANAVLTRDEKA
jgi:hypothetical protein